MRISEVMKAAISSFIPPNAAKGPELDFASGESVPAIINATRRGDHSMVVIGLATGNDVNATDDLGRTALHFAAAQNLPTIVHSLLSAGAHPNIADFEGYIPLHRAIEQQSIAIVTSLLGSGADPLARTLKNQSSIDLAATSGNRIIIEILKNLRH